jgi:hypothetical protein
MKTTKLSLIYDNEFDRKFFIKTDFDPKEVMCFEVDFTYKSLVNKT